ncbi:MULTISPECIES: DUF2145 domain-containing protein [Maricaulis]|uniref:DUF2145 domain-containing protein n=1 Tax=Maricaulis TaxID=74317 RepID=UPI003A92C5A8
MSWRGLTLALALGLAGPQIAEAGSSATPVTPFPVEDSADFSKQIERELASQGARVAMVFRTGRAREDLPAGIRYTHGAFWVYSELETVDGRRIHGYAVHNLYHGEDDRRTSYLVQDWPLNFTQGDVVGEAGIIIPTPEMQARLAAILVSDAETLHQPDYSLLSNPHDPRFQNCTEYMLDLVAAAAWETRDRAQITANLTAWFEPTPVEVSLLERLLGPTVDERIRLEDQRGTIRTATYRSLADFMTRYGLSERAYEITADFLSEAGPGPTG